MSYPVSRREQSLDIPANQPVTFPLGGVDYLYFHTVPAGVNVKLNGESESSFLQGETHQAEPGSNAIQSVTFLNTTGSNQSVRVVFGLGRMTVAGVATLSGAIPLPSGAATSANQSTANGHLATLATPVARSPKLRAIAGGGSETIAACRWVEWFNKSTTENMTVTITGEAAYTVGPREGGGLPMLHPRESSYPQIVVACAAAGSGVVSFIV